MGAGTSAVKANSSNAGNDQLQATTSASADPRLQSLLAQVGNGSVSMADALKQAGAFTSAANDPNAGQRSQYQDRLNYLKSVNAGGGNGNEQDQLQGLINGLPSVSQMPSGSQYQDAFKNLAYTDPTTGTMLAGQQVMEQPGMHGLYDKGGVQDQAQARVGQLNNYFDTGQSNLTADRNSLMGRDSSYGLQDSDLQAYAQGSANIGRQFAGAQQSLAQSLADRGLGAGPSGASAMQFSGLMGNNMEQLAGLQQQISQQRIQTAQGLAQARTNADLSNLQQINAATGNNNNLVGNLGSLYQNSLNDQFNRNTGGLTQQNNLTSAAASAAGQNQALQQNVNNSGWDQQNSSELNPGKIGVGLLGSAVSGAASGASAGAGNKIFSK